MADSFTPNLNLRKPEVGFADDTWGGVAGLNGDLDILDAIFAATGLGTAVGLNVGAAKTADMTGGTLKATGDRFVLQDGASPTKKARFLLTNLPSGTTRDFVLPVDGDVLVGANQSQNLVNKTVTDPVPAANTQAVVSAHWVNAAIAAAVSAAIAAYNAFNTGDVMASSNAKPGWLILRGGTIGNAGSGATEYASAAAQNLFNHFWALNSNTWPINGGRGASAAADFAALKTVTMPDMQGRALIGTGGTIGLGSYFATTGAATVSLTAPQIAAHTHGVTPPVPRVVFAALGGVGGGGLVTDSSNDLTVTDASTGTGAAHDNVQPSMGIVWWIKL